MVNPGTFRGSRREFLIQEIEGYIKAVEEGRAAEFIADVVRRYLKRYPLSLTHNVEPSPEHLAKVNDSAPDPEVVFPDEDKLSFEEYEKEMFKYQEDKKALKYRAEQIRRWLRYQYSKRRDMSAKDTGADNPWTVLLHRLTGVGLSKPRKPQAFTLWSKANATDVDAAWQLNLEELKKKNRPMEASKRAASFQSFKSKMYRELSKEEKKSWEDLATEDHEVAMKEYEEKLHAPVSKEPQDMQACLERLPSVIKPLIDVVVEATGCLVSVYVGGPEPADGGRLHISSFHGGKTLGSVKQTFVEAERDKYKSYILPIYGNFLKKCFTVEMCRARALPANTPTLESIGFAAEAEGVALHCVDGDMYNTSGGKESIPKEAPARTQATSKSKKVLREPPMKKVTKLVAKQPAQGEGQDSGTSNVTGSGMAAEPTGAPSATVQNNLDELNGGGSQSPSSPKAPEIDKMAKLGAYPAASEAELQPDEVEQPPNLVVSNVDVDGLLLRSPPMKSPTSPSSHNTGGSPPLSPAVSRASSPTAVEASSPMDIPAALESNLPVDNESRQRNEEKEGGEVEQKHRRMAKSKKDNLEEGTGAERVQGKRKRMAEASSDIQRKGLESAKSKRIRTSAKNSKTNTSDSDRQNESSTSPVAKVALKLDLPKDAPKWAISAITLFQRESIPVQFSDLVNKWIKFEVQENNWKHSGKFMAADRPKAVGDWINRARTDRFRLQAVRDGVDPVQEFSTKFWLWWSQLQPDFRQRDESDISLAVDEEGHPDRNSNGDWEALRLPGMNGWVSILAALCFWAWIVDGMSEQGYREKAAADRAREDWRKAVEDVDFVLGHLL